MKKPKALVLSGYGLNSEEETKFAFLRAGAKSDIVHINDLIIDPFKLNDYQILAFPGGFAYGDDTGAGNAFAHKVKNHLWEKLLKFIESDKLIIGICNGFQILVNLGLVPALGKKYGKREVALNSNKFGRYLVRWVDLQVENNSPWLFGISQISLPISHGEGNFLARREVLEKLKRKKMVALRYIKGEMCDWFGYETNPNGAQDDIAGITDETGRILGLMPHPERGQFFCQLPNWTYWADKYRRKGKLIPKDGPGIQIFKNSVRYFR